MRVFNRKHFWTGVLFILLGLLLPVFSPVEMDALRYGVCAMFLLAGAFYVWRSRSHTLAKRDEIHEIDERDQLIRQKTRSFTLDWTRTLCVWGWILLQGVALYTQESVYSTLGWGLLLVVAASFLVELAAWLYYRAKT